MTSFSILPTLPALRTKSTSSVRCASTCSGRGCILKEKRDDATYVVEARSGAIGTDRHDLLYGIPSTNIGGFMPLPGVPQSIPEIPLAKKTVQRGVAKIAVFAFNRQTGRPLWQSGVKMVSNDARDTWVFGVGPFQRGSIYPKTSFAGHEIRNPLARRNWDDVHDPIWVAQPAYFEPERQIAGKMPRRLPHQRVAVPDRKDSKVRRASGRRSKLPNGRLSRDRRRRSSRIDLPYGAPMDINSVVPDQEQWPSQ